MPCYRCGARQDDPARGASPWKRGVRAGGQVLICPQCQQRPDWRDDLDHCPGCGRTALVRSLGDTVCRDCGRVGTTTAADHDPAPEGSPSALATEVAAAVARVLGRGPGAEDGPGAGPAPDGRGSAGRG